MMWEMPLWVLIALIVAVTAAIYFLLRPLRVLGGKEFVVSHGFITIGLILISVWLWLNRGDYQQMAMVIGGMWTAFGGLCFMAVYVLRKSITNRGENR